MKVGYARVSSTDQNLSRQVESLKAANVEKIFLDKASGKSLERQGLSKLLEYVREGDLIAIHSLDRLGRSMQDLINLLESLTAKGLQVTFLTEQITYDPSNAVTTLMLQQLAAFAQFERTLSKARQREGIQQAKKRGVYKGRPVAFTAAQKREAKAMLEAGETVTNVAINLNVSRGTLYKHLELSKAG